MKGGLVVGAHAMRLLAEGPRPFGRVELVSVPDEEPRTAPFGTLARVGGFDAALCLECGRPGGAIVTARKGAVWAELRAHGRAAHAGVAPDDGRNAVVALAREALRIAGLHRSRPGLTVQVTRLVGGDVKNSVPAYAELGIDLRAATEADLDWAVRELQATAAADGIRFEAEVAGTPPLERTDAVVALAALAQRARPDSSASRSRRPAPAASPTAAGRPTPASPRSTGSARSARSTTRRTSGPTRPPSPPAAGSSRGWSRPSTARAELYACTSTLPLSQDSTRSPRSLQRRRDGVAAAGRDEHQHAAGRHALARQRRRPRARAAARAPRRCPARDRCRR